MSEKKQEETSAEEPKKKKKGKLPVILALVLVLGGGGYFMFGKSKAKPGKPEVKIGHEVVDIGEVLVNLRGSDSYARATVALQFAEGFDSHGVDKQKAVIRDAIISALSDSSLSELKSAEGRENLKVEIAASINEALHAMHPEPDSGKKDGGKDEGGESHEDAKPKKRKHPEWHSDDGPVLKVYFSDFVTQ